MLKLLDVDFNMLIEMRKILLHKELLNKFLNVAIESAIAKQISRFRENLNKKELEIPL